jgi:hypothetical protein
MKFTFLLTFLYAATIISSCKKDPDSLTVINSESFHQKQIEIHFPVHYSEKNDTLNRLDFTGNKGQAMNELNELISLFQKIQQSEDDELWAELKNKWKAFNTTYFGANRTVYSDEQSTNDSIKGEFSLQVLNQWAQLNADLLKFSEEVRFGDALEVMVYGNYEYNLSDSMLKSVIYTHVFDDIYINIIGSSSIEYQHTTGGKVKMVQNTNYPQGNEMILSFETGDLRLLNVYIRIPSWAKNPKVSYGNIKYVANPGEYCEISKKWKMGDELIVSLKN